MPRSLSAIDRFIVGADRALRTLVPGSSKAARHNPAADKSSVMGDEYQRRHIAGLMRINHTGEVCAQALYQGQGLTAKSRSTRDSMKQAADEEIDHLAWCEQRLGELDAGTSVLNPLFYAASFSIGAAAGLVSDSFSLGFVAATEAQVSQHLRDHLQQIPDSDPRSRSILKQMLEDEEAHGAHALEVGGKEFAADAKQRMTLLSKVMTSTTYYI